MRSIFSKHRSREKPRLPDGVRIYAMTDIHGCAHLLSQMLTIIDLDVARSPPRHSIEVFMGDYIDRGPDSRSTIDILIERSRRGNVVFLRGNHESYLLKVLNDPLCISDWLQAGGLQTLVSYGLKPSLTPDAGEQIELANEFIQRMPPHHYRFLSNLRLTFTCGDFFFVHAGVRPGVPLSDQQEHDLLWIREEFLQSRNDFGKYIVHGHTPVQTAQVLENRANIDTGAYATGNLTLLSIQGSRLLAI
jgi:serine/threonine protein phosphatase 1